MHELDGEVPSTKNKIILRVVMSSNVTKSHLTMCCQSLYICISSNFKHNYPLFTKQNNNYYTYLLLLLTIEYWLPHEFQYIFYSFNGKFVIFGVRRCLSLNFSIDLCIKWTMIISVDPLLFLSCGKCCSFILLYPV